MQEIARCYSSSRGIPPLPTSPHLFQLPIPFLRLLYPQADPSSPSDIYDFPFSDFYDLPFLASTSFTSYVCHLPPPLSWSFPLRIGNPTESSVVALFWILFDLFDFCLFLASHPCFWNGSERADGDTASCRSLVPGTLSAILLRDPAARSWPPH